MDSELVQSLIKHFSKLERMQKLYLNEALKASGLKGMMYKYILSIKRHPGVSQDFLAEFHSVDKSRVARVARQLESLNYIARAPDEADRRHYRLFLTESGEAMYENILKILLDWGNLISGGISAADLETTISTIHRMIQNSK